MTEATIGLRERARCAREERRALEARQATERRAQAEATARSRLVAALMDVLSTKVTEDDERITVRESGQPWGDCTAFIEIDGILLTGYWRSSGTGWYEVAVVRPCEQCGREAWNAVGRHNGLAGLADVLDGPGLHASGCDPEPEMA